MNRLSAETSPYLLQHADNPVDWWPWGEEAFAEAKRTNRPILLSVGYAACHWCHVMAHESFEDAGSRRGDERAVRQHQGRSRGAARSSTRSTWRRCRSLGERGGWPLSMFLTPDGGPFFGGTYFPPAPRVRPAELRRRAAGVAQAFRDKPHEVETNRAGLLMASRQ